MLVKFEAIVFIYNWWSISNHTYYEATVFIYYWFNRHSSVREISLMILIAYLSYILAEVMIH